MNWVLDFDGTLIDSSHDIKVAINQLRSDVNLPPCSRDEVRDAIGHGALELLET
ncbi:MAG: HAD family hydrolase, partial [bacterium]